MRAMARRLGWNVTSAAEFAADFVPEYGKHDIQAEAPPQAAELLRVGASSAASSTSWRSKIATDRLKEIERLNKVDLVVFRKALSRFNERFGEVCHLPYEPSGPALRSK